RRDRSRGGRQVHERVRPGAETDEVRRRLPRPPGGERRLRDVLCRDACHPRRRPARDARPPPSRRRLPGALTAAGAREREPATHAARPVDDRLDGHPRLRGGVRPGQLGDRRLDGDERRAADRRRARRAAGRVTASSLLWGAVAMLPLALGEWLAGQRPVWSRAAVAGTLYLGVVVTGLGYLVWNWALRRVEAPRAAIFLCVQPVVGA